MTAVSLHFYTYVTELFCCFSMCKGRSQDEQVRTDLTSLKLLPAKALKRQGRSFAPTPRV